MKLLSSLLAITFGVVHAGAAPATLTFDDVALAPGDYRPLQSGYGGLHWGNFGAFNVSQFAGTSGYRIGMVSPPNIAFNLSGAPVNLRGETGFTLHSAYLTSAYDLRVGTFAVHVRVQGAVGTNVTYDNTYTVSNTAPALIDFNYVGVERVIFVATPDVPFAMDNLTVTVPPPEASCTYVVSPRSRLHGFGSETGMVSVTAQPGCAWSVLNTNAWVKILSSLENSGNATVIYTVAAEPTSAARSGFIKIAGQSFAVSQSARPPDGGVLLTFEDLLPYPVPMPNDYGGLQWDNWGVLDASLLPMTSGRRTGMISPNNIAFSRSDGVFIRNDVPFTLKSAFLTSALDSTSGAGAAAIHVRVQGSLAGAVLYDHTCTVSNTSPTFIDFDYVGVDRVAFVGSPSYGIVADNMTVIVPPPDACAYGIAPRDRRHGFGAETGAVSVVTQAGCPWTVINTNPWVTILSSPNGSASGTVTYAVAAQPTAATRSGFVNIAGQNFMVTQSDLPMTDPDLLTFDELLPLMEPISSGYGGLNWENFGVINGSVRRATSGYRTGVVSPDNVAFNLSGGPAAISRDAPFTLKSAYLTEQVFNRMQLRVSGWVGNRLAYDNTYALNPTGPIFVEFNYVGVNRVTFSPMPGSIFVVDNLRVNVPPPDSDGDGVLDTQDQCPDTPSGMVVDERGCSIEQLVPCDGPAAGGAWSNHGQYVLAVTQVATAFESAGLITAGEKRAVIQAASQSDCGKRQQRSEMRAVLF